ncbi:MAG: prepilin-type N-terminal cleavage/methylation domain-containing protein [Candidatus Omnitrophica bacterium]|nr:prepilin-type N-terminal cleavage/methylation domain-containing protein [Candidatus Omnitrophota bacterium]
MRRAFGFTLMEILIVIAILGLMIGFAVPDFHKAIDHKRRDIAYLNLRVLHGAARIRGSYPDGKPNLAAINASLGNNVNVVDNTKKTTYCSDLANGIFRITATINAGECITVTANNPLSAAYPATNNCTNTCGNVPPPTGTVTNTQTSTGSGTDTASNTVTSSGTVTNTNTMTNTGTSTSTNSTTGTNTNT